MSADIQYAKVLDTAGIVEVLALPNQHWAPLQKKTLLRKGTSVRTRANSRVWMTLDPQMETLVELGENSYLNIWTEPPSRVSLKTGRLYVFRESEPTAPPFKILTPQILVEIPSGGAILDVSPKGSLLSVFAEQAVVKGKKIEEGFKFFKKNSGEESLHERMRYADYVPWKTWVEKMYEVKDDFAADILEKELGQ